MLTGRGWAEIKKEFLGEATRLQVLNQRHGYYYRRSELFQVLESHNEESMSQAVGSESSQTVCGVRCKVWAPYSNAIQHQRYQLQQRAKQKAQ